MRVAGTPARLMRLPLWIPDGEDGWILSFPGGAQLWFEKDQKSVWGFERRPLTKSQDPEDAELP